MRLIVLLLTLLFLSQNALPAQDITFTTPADSSKTARIAAARRHLDTAFLYDDLISAGLWMDSLTRMEDDQQVALVWDERWLLYFWSGALSNALDEAARYDADERIRQSWKNQPPNDSLFEHLDRTLLERQYQLFADIRQAFLNEEEKAFATLLLEYLLRINGASPSETELENLNGPRGIWAAKIDNFLAKYPKSRFGKYLRSIKPYIPKVRKDALGIYAAFQHGEWTDQLERSLRPLNGLEFGFYYWRKRMNYQLGLLVGGNKLARDVVQNGYVWPKKDVYSAVFFHGEVGYDLLDKTKLRVFPTIGGGFSRVRPPEPDDDDEPLPDYYYGFRFSSGHLMAVLNIDLKMLPRSGKHYNQTGVKGSYNGPRLRVGYQRLWLDRKNPALRGNLFFVSIGYNLHGRLTEM